MRTIAKMVFTAFLTAVFLWCFYLVQLQVMTDMYISGYKSAEKRCTKPGVYFPPNGDTKTHAFENPPHRHRDSTT